MHKYLPSTLDSDNGRHTLRPYGRRKYSPSQLQSWNACSRKWFFTYILGIRAPQTESQRLGTKVHEILEAYGKGESIIDGSTRAGEIALAAIGSIPGPGVGRCEGDFTAPINADFCLHGIIDRIIERPGKVLLIDYKTTSSFRYALTEEGLLNDTQATIYSWYALQLQTKHFPLSEIRIFLRWVYLLTSKGKSKAKAVSVEIPNERVIEQGNAIIEKIETIEKVRKHIEKKKLDVLDMPPSPKHCSEYGGCFFRDKCNDVKRTDLFG